MSGALFWIAPPLLAVTAAEIGLRLAGVRVPRYAGLVAHCDYWIPSDAPGRPPGFVRAFPRNYRFHPEESPLFLRDKPANGYRVFVVGESSVYGWPFDVGAFTDWMRVRLRAMLPGRTVEVVNAGNPGWPAFDTRALLEECIEHAPDLFVWMAGDSEYVPQNVYRLREELLSPALAGVRRALYDSRILHVLSLACPSLSNQRLFLGEHGAKEELPCYGAEIDLLKRRYREALAGAVAAAQRARVDIVVCTLPRNAHDKAPLNSFFSERLRADRALHDAWDRAYARGLALLESKNAPAALELFETARAIDDSPARLHFAMGRAYEAAGSPEPARAAFLRAVELDACPMRAPEWIDAAIRDVTAAARVPRVELRAAFDAAGKNGLAGSELLLDNVHPTLEGHARIADEILRVVERDLGLALDRARDPHPERVRSELGLDRYQAHLGARSACVQSVDALLRLGKSGDRWKEARAAGERALATIPNDWEVVGAVGVLDALGGQHASARVRIHKAMAFDSFVRTSFLARHATDEAFRRSLDGAGVDVAPLEASLTPDERLVVESRIARARSRRRRRPAPSTRPRDRVSLVAWPTPVTPAPPEHGEAAWPRSSRWCSSRRSHSSRSRKAFSRSPGSCRRATRA